MESNNNIELDVRVYPLDAPKGSTKAFASVTFNVNGEDIAAITGIRLVQDDKGVFMTMPQTQDKYGEYHDIAFPVQKGLRDRIKNAVLKEYGNLVPQEPRRDFNERMAEGAVLVPLRVAVEI